MQVTKIIFKVSRSIEELGSFLMKSILRISGAKIGRNTFVSFNSRILSRDLQIGDDCFIKGNTRINGKRVRIGNNTIISDRCYITGPDNFFIGSKSFIGKNVRIQLSKEVRIGNDVAIADSSKIFTHGTFFPVDNGYPMTFESVIIGDNVWISSSSIILPRVKIGNDVIIGPGTVITKSIASDSIINGNPARFITNTSKLRNQKSFLFIIEKIFKQTKDIQFIANGKGYSVFESLGRKKVYAIDGNLIDSKFLDIKKGEIIIFKFLKDSSKYRNNDYYWFDLDKREMTYRNSKSFKFIQDILRENGIRLVKDYLN